jgi:hypothetical protein
MQISMWVSPAKPVSVTDFNTDGHFPKASVVEHLYCCSSLLHFVSKTHVAQSFAFTSFYIVQN